MPPFPMALDPYTGRPLSKLMHLDGFSGTNARDYLQRQYPDTNIANLCSMAAIVGKTPAYVEQLLAQNPDLIHSHRLRVIDHRGKCLMALHQTHVSSLVAGFQAYEARVLEGQISRVGKLRAHRT